MADSKKETAYVLEDGFQPASSEPQVFVGFPGRWLPGEPVAVATLGFSEEDADTRILLDELPLRKVQVARADHGFARTGGMVSGAELRSESTAGDTGDRSPMAGLSTSEFEDLVAAETEQGQFSPVVEVAMETAGIEPPTVERRWPDTHAGLDALAAEHQITFTEDAKTVSDKQAALETAGVEAPVVGAES